MSDEHLDYHVRLLRGYLLATNAHQTILHALSVLLTGYRSKAGGIVDFKPGEVEAHLADLRKASDPPPNISKKEDMPFRDTSFRTEAQRLNEEFEAAKAKARDKKVEAFLQEEIQEKKAKKTTRERWTPELDNKVLELNAAGRSARLIGEEIGRTSAAVGTRLFTLRQLRKYTD